MISDIKRALVTGASGFIGTVLCRTLAEHDVQVVGLMRHRVAGPWEECVCVDLCCEPLSIEALKGVDTVFHLAGKAHAIEEAHANTHEYYRANTQATKVVLDAAVTAGVKRFVYFSSIKAMGDDPLNCQDETSQLAPASPYGRSKRAAEDLVLEVGRERAIQVSVLRLPLVYGPAVKGNLAAMIKAIANNRFPPIKVTENKRSMVHVDDVAAVAVMAACTKGAAGEIFIVTDGVDYSTSDLYALIRTALGKSVPRWYVPLWLLAVAARFGDIYAAIFAPRFPLDSAALERLTNSASYSSKKAQAVLGFTPRRRLESALDAIVKQAVNSG